MLLSQIQANMVYLWMILGAGHRDSYVASATNAEIDSVIKGWAARRQQNVAALQAESIEEYSIVTARVISTRARNNEDGVIFLERGQPGTLPCPLVASGQIPISQIESQYWYYPTLENGNVLISYFLGVIAPQNGIPQGVYDINGNFSLVMQNVTDSDEGTYYCRVKPRLRPYVDGQVTMRVKVSPMEQFPDVTECTQRLSESECEVKLSEDIEKPRLTCIVRDTKPAVSLRWLLEYSDGDTALISDKFTVQPSTYSVNAFTTSASIPIVASNVNTAYRCGVYGEALGARNGSHAAVTVTTASFTLQTPQFTSLGPVAEMTVAGNAAAMESRDNSRTWLIVPLGLSLAANVCFGIALLYKTRKKKSGQANDKSNNNREVTQKYRPSGSEETCTCLNSEANDPQNTA